MVSVAARPQNNRFSAGIQFRRLPKALTWQAELGFSHLKIDEGDRGLNRSPILVMDGLFDYGSVVDALTYSMRSLDPDISELVIRKLEEYAKTRPVL